MNDEARSRVTVDAPQLGTNVELVEATVGEVLPLIAQAEGTGSSVELIMGTLAASLRIDGAQMTVAQLRGLGAKKLKALMALGPQALAINGFAPEETAADEKKD